MSDYRRNRVPGGTYFFTVNLRDRRSDLLVTQVDALRNSVRQVMAKSPFYIDAWAVLPEHRHCVWTLPENDADYSKRWRAIKTFFAKAVSADQRDGRGVWQNRFWEHTIRDETDYAAHMDYTHFNPVKHGLVQNVADWPFSSFRQCVAKGVYPTAWAKTASELTEAGERR
jgi:REP-associated tyrosine transposase